MGKAEWMVWSVQWELLVHIDNATHWTILRQVNLSTLRILLQLAEWFLSFRHIMGATLNYKNIDHKALIADKPEK